ncbi:putative NAD-dependent epimerase/dehydratase family protein|uniref:Putative NAD-dependent epimerase/dehydratase family protein n=1 Tax=Brenneria salicis ATCC 15712 = DSM 30166 TaxID=714314 RepID=A0A366I9Q5_9GAMM|nr:N-acetyltransferase DgcN [Brenneria salicis]NMN90993.1 putative NAD-dependent epimerase/dehydratase family protein [Brenneria salicis ATCC 15712 = DSM 30166]RBP66487.1 putative NAD-dependent epimerase/dehydratase family protein [Brenneria salicis ATCC 15712 = DSM 30166]RLM32059.1 EBNA-1 nuclear protein [Brenneria salicis ATCC 15712 = DSM 30166]
MDIKKPYLLFLGDAHDQLAAKVAIGIKQWHPEYCVGQYRMDGCHADCDLPDMDISAARAAGAKTLVIGVANRGGIISQQWIAVLSQALESGMDLAAGLHNCLSDVPELRKLAAKLGRSLFDVRHPSQTFPVANGRKRSGKRLLPVGTDCSCGKMYTALAIEREILSRGGNATFRATGQTGILISGSGVSIDAVVSDFIAGAVETLSPANDENHWDIIEGQGSLFHPSFAGVTTGIIHGAQPDALVLCHEPTRKTMRGVDYPIPDIADCMALNLSMAKLTNPNARFVGISINSAALSEEESLQLMADLEKKFGLPVVDPFRQGVGRIVDQLADL